MAFLLYLAPPAPGPARMTVNNPETAIPAPGEHLQARGEGNQFVLMRKMILNRPASVGLVRGSYWRPCVGNSPRPASGPSLPPGGYLCRFSLVLLFSRGLLFAGSAALVSTNYVFFT